MIDTDDLVQDVVLRTLGRIGAFEHRGEGALLAYMRRALQNRIADIIRQVIRRPVTEPLEETRSSDDCSPLELAIGSEALEQYERALARLEEGERGVLVARIELGLSYDEIARAVGKPSADAARMSVSRALLRLAAEMSHGED